MTRPASDLRTQLAVYPVFDLGERLPRGVTPSACVAALLRGGATMIQLRDKADRASRLLALAAEIRAWCRQACVPLIVNDSVALALAAAADGVHVGQRDASIADVRARASAGGRPELIVGASIRTVAEASRALDEGATYLSASPVFATPTKTDAEPAVGLAGVARLRGRFPTAPLVAIGGIDRGRATQVVEVGADGVAFISAVRTTPERSIRALRDAVDAGLRARASDTCESEVGHAAG